MTVRSIPLALLLALASPAFALAQTVAPERPPEACGMTDASARFGGLEVGMEVTLQRHRSVGGDENWDPGMAHFLGRVARITRLASVDEAGCPGVRVDLDGGTWFWRARDLGIGTGPQPRPARTATSVSAGGFPQQCHQDEARPEYGPAAPGAEVVLGRHRAVDGDDNWAAEMEPFVGRTARVVDFAGVDGAGCPGVRVDLDSQQWFWRVRDLRLPSAPGAPPVVGGTPPPARTGVTHDHGRPAAVIAPSGPTDSEGLFGPTTSAIPQACGFTDATVQWGPVAVGSAVVLGRHRDVGGETNWSDEMTPFVGRTARVTELIGVDDQGCAVAHIDADGGAWFWRVRDMQIP